MKNLESKLVSALIKDCRRSDRELGKSLGVSQPTVTRLRTKLEKEGYIQEYTMLPNFSKIGFEILAFTFYKLKIPLTTEQILEARKSVMDRARVSPSAVIMALGGIGGIDADRVIVSFHESYSSYVNFLKEIRQIPNVIVAESKSFLVDLEADVHFFPLSFSRLAQYVSKRNETLGSAKEKHSNLRVSRHRSVSKQPHL